MLRTTGRSEEEVVEYEVEVEVDASLLQCPRNQPYLRLLRDLWVKLSTIRCHN